MPYSPDRKPLRELTDGQLREMAINAAQTVNWSFNDIMGELTYREQRRLSKWVALFIGGTLVAHILAIAVNAIL